MTDNKQYPELPKHLHTAGYLSTSPALYTAAQMRQYVDEDRAMRAAQQPGDERKAFEHAERASDLTRDEEGDYLNPCVQSAWEGWQARGKFGVSQPPAGWAMEAYQLADALPIAGKNEDVYRWALDAASLLNKLRAPKAEPVQQSEREPLTAREIELIDGMIEVQLHHANRSDNIGNRPMAEKQKARDMERVELLKKLKASYAQKEPLTDAEIARLAKDMHADLWGEGLFRFARAIEAAHGITAHKEHPC